MNVDRKLRMLLVIFGFIFVAIWLRLFYWQVISGERLSVDAEDQHFSTFELPARRGEIKFSDGSPLVSDRAAFLFYANLSKLPANKSELADKICEILVKEIPDVSTDSATITVEEKDRRLKTKQETLLAKILERLNMPGATWVNLAHFVGRETKDQIEKLNISGLGFVEEETRDYPEASMAAHLVGFVGSDKNGNPKGYFGIEGFYQRELAGRFGKLRLEKDAYGRPIPIGSETRVDKQDGRNLLTTIDRGVQYFSEKSLKQGIADWKASGGTVVVMDPNTGAIIAMASFPNYDPGNFSYYKTEFFKDPAVANLYEPGSIMKPIVMASAINEGKLEAQTKCDNRCDGPRKIGEYYVHTFNNQYHPNLTMTDVLVNSDNTGMIFIGEKLGFENLYQYMKKFGFGQKSGIDLGEEEEGGLRKISEYYPIDQATMTFGQGIQVNVIQMVRAFAVLANGGKLVTPYVVSAIESNGEKFPVKHDEPRQVINSTTAKVLTEMLVEVAEKSPIHFPWDRIPEIRNFKIAAKSGTAQIAAGGKYKETGTTASVIGYFPADKPKYLVYVKLNEPEVRPWGSDTAGPVFFNIIKDLAYYYGISP